MWALQAARGHLHGLNCEPPTGQGVASEPRSQGEAAVTGPAQPVMPSLEAVQHGHLVRDRLLLLVGEEPSCRGLLC